MLSFAKYYHPLPSPGGFFKHAQPSVPFCTSSLMNRFRTVSIRTRITDDGPQTGLVVGATHMPSTHNDATQMSVCKQHCSRCAIVRQRSNCVQSTHRMLWKERYANRQLNTQSRWIFQTRTADRASLCVYVCRYANIAKITRRNNSIVD